MSNFWLNRVVREILQRKEKSYLITDYKTPSGRVHVGALRGVLIHDVITEGLKKSGAKADYWYGFDDFDSMDALPDYLSKEKYQKHLGEPLSNIPSPESGYRNYAYFYAQEFKKVFNNLGAEPKILWASELYKKGKYNKATKIILDNAEEIRKIYSHVSGSKKPKDWYAFQVVCPKCGKIGTTRVYDWDGREVSFVCEKRMVDWAKGCGYQGKISPYNGNGTMPYKVETAAKWFVFGTAVELAGKDHYTKGGTFDVAREIARKVFKIKPAYGFGYEWLLIKGKSMSSSKGVGVAAKEIAQIIPAELLRFLMVRYPPKRQLEFDPQGEIIPRLYDELDRCIDVYLEDPKSDLARAYYYSRLSEAKPPKYRLRFSKVVYLIQMYRTNVYKYAEEEKGQKLTKEEKEEIKTRVQYAKKWLEKYAPENYKFEIQQKLPPQANKLTKEQKEFLSEIVKLLEQKKWPGEELHRQIHQIKKQLKIEPRQAFAAIYLSLLGKDSGPQAGWLLVALDKNFVIKRFKEIQ